MDLRNPKSRPSGADLCAVAEHAAEDDEPVGFRRFGAVSVYMNGQLPSETVKTETEKSRIAVAVVMKKLKNFKKDQAERPKQFFGPTPFKQSKNIPETRSKVACSVDPKIPSCFHHIFIIVE